MLEGIRIVIIPLKFITIKELDEAKGHITENGECIYEDIEPLVKYAREKHWDVLRDRAWLKDAAIYWWYTYYDPIEVSDDFVYKWSLRETWFWQRRIAKYVLQRCVGYSRAMERNRKEQIGKIEPPGGTFQ